MITSSLKKKVRVWERLISSLFGSPPLLVVTLYIVFFQGMLVNERLAAQQMTSGAKTGIAYTSLSQAGIQLTTEPFFKSLLVALYKDRMQNLLSRARILLPPAEARLMIGVMDETGTLKPGEVRMIIGN